MFYATSLAREGLKHSTIKIIPFRLKVPPNCKRSSESLYQLRLSPSVGLCHAQDPAESGFTVKPRLPISPVILDCLQDHLLARNTQDDLMLWAASMYQFLWLPQCGGILVPF